MLESSYNDTGVVCSVLVTILAFYTALRTEFVSTRPYCCQIASTGADFRWWLGRGPDTGLVGCGFADFTRRNLWLAMMTSQRIP